MDLALEPILRTVPALASGLLRITALPGGITNENYLVEVDGSDARYVVRVPGRDTHLLGIDRDTEVAATRAAAALGDRARGRRVPAGAHRSW